MIRLRPILLSLMFLITATLVVGPVTAVASCVSATGSFQVDIAGATHEAPLTSDPCGTTDDFPDFGVSVPVLPISEHGWLDDAYPLHDTGRCLLTQTVERLVSLTSPGPESPPPNSRIAS